MRSSSLPAYDERRRPRTVFWVYVGAGVLTLAVAWIWFGLSVYEEYSEQGKAEVAGTTMEGTAAVLGGVPLALAHMIGLILLALYGWRGWRSIGIVYALAAVVVTSLIGLGLAQLLFEERVFGYE